MLKVIIKALIPPILLKPLSWLRRVLKIKKSDVLFDGDDYLFKKTVNKNSIYSEYGCGASTIWVANTIGCRILSVDSSYHWIDKVKKESSHSNQITIHLADVGPVGEWGRPISYEKSSNFSDYTDWIWAQQDRPSVVLVDGRFRVCCFLTSLLNAEPGTQILFDDYINRPNYHFVEKYLKPNEICGRQALFIVPEKEQLDVHSIQEDINSFRFVFD